MSVHIFIGAGPANLHRALKIKNIDPNALLVIVDACINTQLRALDRDHARATIFHFETEEVAKQLIADGVDEAALGNVSYERDFFAGKGFQHGDEAVFSPKRFTEIQIRDLQQLLLQALDNLPGTKPILFSDELEINNADEVESVVAHLLYENQSAIPLTQSNPTIQIHAAMSVLQHRDTQSATVYAVQDKFRILTTASDKLASKVRPIYGMTTFFIRHPDSGAQYVSCRELENDQRSLDTTDWNGVLRGYGWDLIRPPRARVFYANDVLYLGAEIPVKMMALGDDDYQNAVTNYTRAIASLVFPHINISELPVNAQLHARLQRERGLGEPVLSTAQHYSMPWGEGRRAVVIQVFNHGHSRYLSHYQTGSGFITAFLQNEIYAGIYQHNTLHDLFTWAQAQHHVANTVTEDKLQQHYARIVCKRGCVATNQLILQAFQCDLFMALSRDIIDENQAVVGRYFNAIHSQTLEEINNHFDEILAFYNQCVGTHLSVEQFAKLDKRLAVLQMLKQDNIAFLYSVMPRLLNLDISSFDNDELLNMRDVYLLDYESNLPEINNRQQMLEACEVILKKEALIAKIRLLPDNEFKQLVNFFLDVHRYDNSSMHFPMENKLIVFMEMLNRNGLNIQFLRRTLSWLFEINLSSYADAALYALRDQFTENYIELLDKHCLNAVAMCVLGQEKGDSAVDILKKAIGLDELGLHSFIQDTGLPLILKQRDSELLTKRLLGCLFMKILEKNNTTLVPSAELTLSTHQLIAIEPHGTAATIRSIADTYANRTLHQRTSFLFFRERHSDTISAFIEELRILATRELPSERLKVRFIAALEQFYEKIAQDQDKRPLLILDEVVNAELEALATCRVAL